MEFLEGILPDENTSRTDQLNRWADKLRKKLGSDYVVLDPTSRDVACFWVRVQGKDWPEPIGMGVEMSDREIEMYTNAV